jgi:integrase/recombinase XerD
VDLRQYTARCTQHGLHVFAAKRVDIESFRGEMATAGRARAAIARRLCTIAGFSRSAVEEELLDHSPAAHARRPRLDHESHPTALDRNELGALLVAARLGAAREHALISLLAWNGLRISEALGADITATGSERGHRTLTVLPNGAKIVTIPLAPRTARSLDLATGERLDAPILLRADRRRLDRHGARTDRAPRRQTGRHQQADQPAHPAARLHHRRPRRRRPTPRRPGSRLARRPTHHHPLRPSPRLS